MKGRRLLNFIVGLSTDFTNLLRGYLTVEVVLIEYLLRMRMFKQLIISNMVIKLPDDIRIFINDEATLDINIPDHYLRKEYTRHTEYIPSKGWTVLDVGAYIGIYTLWASKRVGDEGFVVAFEPNPLVFRWLVSNIEINNIENVKVLPYALGDKITKATLYIAGENIEASSLIKRHLTNNPSSKYTIIGEFIVPVLTLDYIIEKSAVIIGKSITHIDLIKIDVEGYELKVLKGAERILSKGLIERFIIEVHTDIVSTLELIRYLIYYGYKLDKIVRFNHVKDLVYMKRKY
jgi:FkbM family methyltransferase